MKNHLEKRTEMNDHLETETDVLIVGAGPTGLTLAIELRRRGIDCRVVERNDNTVTTSRAIGIQPRTLQVFDDIGILDGILNEGTRVGGVFVYHNTQELVYMDLDNVDTPYPYLWSLSQSRTETMLLDRLEELGGAVEFERKLVGFGQDGEEVTATVSHVDGSGRVEMISADWLIGCDGGRSIVRKTLGLDFTGTTHQQTILNVDAAISWDWPSGEAGAFFHREGVLAALPLPGERRFRLLVDVSNISEEERPDDDASIDTAQRLLHQRTGMEEASIDEITWTSVFTVNQRMVRNYRRNRVFLAGDAAHIHSPIGGLGMNTGIQDAYNLGWKLALVLDGLAPESLLDTYEDERIPVAEGVLEFTGSATRMVASTNPAVQFLRDRLLVPLFTLDRVQSRLFRTNTQLDINYRDSSLSGVHVESPLAELVNTGLDVWGLRDWNAPKAGDCVPEAPASRPDGTDTTLHEELHDRSEFVLLLFAGPKGNARSDLTSIVEKIDEDVGRLVHPSLVVPDHDHVPSQTFSGSVLVDDEGALHDTYGASVPSVFLVRPDDYIAFRSRPARAEPLFDYLNERVLQSHT